MVSLPYLSIHQVSGVDTGNFLHGQLAADVSALADGQSCFAAYCSPRGQVIALLLVFRLGADWLLAGETSLAGAAVSRLQKYVLRAKVEFKTLEHLMVFGLGTQDVATAPVPAYRPGKCSLLYALGDPTATPAKDVAHWRRGELRCGVTWLQPATSDRFLPQMLGFDLIGAVSFTKGCYPGQEIIARARYLGKVKRGPVLLELGDVPQIGRGEGCVLSSEGRVIEAVVVDMVTVEGVNPVVFLVAALEDAALVSALEFGGTSFSARRLPFTPPGEFQLCATM